MGSGKYCANCRKSRLSCRFSREASSVVKALRMVQEHRSMKNYDGTRKPKDSGNNSIAPCEADEQTKVENLGDNVRLCSVMGLI
ncbi:hypothetical protein P3S67_026284 [Capsicum chacoense]